MRLKVSNVCQSFDKATYPATQTNKGVTFTNNSDGTITVNGTATDSGNALSLQVVTLHKDRDYFLYADQSGSFADIVFTVDDLGSLSQVEGNFWTSTVEGKRQAYFWVKSGITIDSRVFKPQFFDLTEMYGAGNEPTTVEQLRQDFPNEMYEYSPVCWKKFRRLKYVTETKNLMTDEMFTSVGFTKQSDGSWYIPDSVVLDGKIMWENTEGVAGPITMSFYGKSPRPYNGGVIQWLVEAVDGTITYRTPTGTSSEWVYGTWTFDSNTVSKVYWVNISNRPCCLRDVMFEWGSTATPYQPYGYLPLNRGKYIANKEPVQLLDKSEFKIATSKNATATPDTTNGMWTISGAATASEYLAIGVCYLGTDFNIGDKLFLRHSNIDNSVYFPYAGYYDKDNKYLDEQDGVGIFSVTNPEISYVACYFATRTVGDINVTTQVQLFNLTRMYGKGNEPTAAEFVAQYPGFDYPVNKYNAITFR